MTDWPTLRQEWETKMRTKPACRTAGYRKCRLPPVLTLAAIDHFQHHFSSDALPGAKYCPIPVLDRAPSRNGRLWSTPFIYRFRLEHHPFALDRLLSELAGTRGAVDFVDADFGTFKARKVADKRTCEASAADAIGHMFAHSGLSQLQCSKGNSRCNGERTKFCIDLQVRMPDGQLRKRTIGMGMSGIQEAGMPVRYLNYLGSKESPHDYNVSKRLWARGVDALGDLHAWGGREVLADTFKANRAFFGTPGMRTPYHVDKVPQILVRAT
jgi:hypothetical protein